MTKTVIAGDTESIEFNGNLKDLITTYGAITGSLIESIVESGTMDQEEAIGFIQNLIPMAVESWEKATVETVASKEEQNIEE